VIEQPAQLQGFGDLRLTDPAFAVNDKGLY
jgi:hypothetical protein